MKQGITGTVCALFSLMVFSSFTTSHTKESTDSVLNTARTTNVPDQFVGWWYYGDVSSTEIYNYSNGSWSNAVGSGLFYAFYKDGTFEFGYRNYVMIGTCNNVGMAYRRGTFTVEGNKLTLYDNYAKLMEEHSCNPSSNYTKDMEKTLGEILFAEPGVDAYGTTGLYLSSPGANASFFKKK